MTVGHRASSHFAAITSGFASKHKTRTRMKLHIVLLFALVSWTVPTEGWTLDTGSDGSSDDNGLGSHTMTFKERMDKLRDAALSSGDGSASSQSDGSGTFREVFASGSDSSRGEETSDVNVLSGSSGSFLDEESTSTSSSASTSNTSNASSEASSVSSNDEDYSIENYPSSGNSSSSASTGSVNLIVDDSASSQSDSSSIGVVIYPSLTIIAALFVTAAAVLI